MHTPRQAARAVVAQMILSRKMTRVLIATLAALALVLPTARPAHAAGLSNCVDVTGPAASHVACYEDVWVNGVQLRMTFANDQFPGTPPGDRLDNFYVLAPQTDTPQGRLPFPHDHVVGDVPRQNHSAYNVQLHAFFVLCSAEGIATDDCVPTMTSVQGLGILPLATTVYGQPLTSVAPIESAVNSGLITLLDSGGVVVGTINPSM